MAADHHDHLAASVAITEISITPDAFFAGKLLPHALFRPIARTVAEVGDAELRLSKSQIAFHYLHGRVAPLALSIALPWRDGSPRWEQGVEPRPGRWRHHLELYDNRGIDGEVRTWLRQAWETAA